MSMHKLAEQTQKRAETINGRAHKGRRTGANGATGANGRAMADDRWVKWVRPFGRSMGPVGDGPFVGPGRPSMGPVRAGPHGRAAPVSNGPLFTVEWLLRSSPDGPVVRPIPRHPDHTPLRPVIYKPLKNSLPAIGYYCPTSAHCPIVCPALGPILCLLSVFLSPGRWLISPRNGYVTCSARYPQRSIYG